MQNLEYSYSNGKFWSAYNQCRVWKNGDYNLKVRDYITKKEVDTTTIVSNIEEDVIVPMPELNLHSYNGNWTNNNVEITILNPTEVVEYSYDDSVTKTWTTMPSSNTIIIEQETNVAFRNKIGEKVSLINAVKINIDKTHPTDLNFQAEVNQIGQLMVEVRGQENQSTPLQYSFTFDNGVTWTNYQIGRFWRIENPSGVYNINCRAKNVSGLIVEGLPIQITV